MQSKDVAVALLAALMLLPGLPVAALAAPAATADADRIAEDAEQGLDLMERGARLFMNSLLDRIAPELDAMGEELGSALGLLAPAMTDIARLMDDIGHYQAPERLENGDILIRRRPDAPPAPPIGEGLQRFWKFDWGEDGGGATPRHDQPPSLPEIEL